MTQSFEIMEHSGFSASYRQLLNIVANQSILLISALATVDHNYYSQNKHLNLSKKTLLMRKRTLEELVQNTVLPHSWSRIGYIVSGLIEAFKYNCHFGINLNPHLANPSIIS